MDASNTFNNLNQAVALVNIYHSCPSIATILINTYRHDSALYIEGETILSREGTTQGDPLAMAMFALAMIPLIDRVKGDESQCWYADDASAGGQRRDLRMWWDKVMRYGPEYGYLPNPGKTWLVVKGEYAASHAIWMRLATSLATQRCRSLTRGNSILAHHLDQKGL